MSDCLIRARVRIFKYCIIYFELGCLFGLLGYFDHKWTDLLSAVWEGEFVKSQTVVNFLIGSMSLWACCLSSATALKDFARVVMWIIQIPQVDAYISVSDASRLPVRAKAGCIRLTEWM